MALRSRKRAAEDTADVDLNDVNANSHPKKARSGRGGEPNSSFPVSSLSKTDANGDRYWEISKLRRVTVSSFRGKIFVNIREYYEKDGQELPGKKGISMPVDQFSSLVTLLPEIEVALKEAGESLPRPEYNNGTAQATESDDLAQEESPGAPEGVTSPKKNIEATSEEDESEE